MADLFDNAQIVLDATQSRPIRVQGAFDLPNAKTLQKGVSQFLTDHSSELAVPFGADTLKLAKADEAPGRQVLRYDHVIDGLRVFGAQTIATVDEENRLRRVDFYAGPTQIVRAAADAPSLTTAAAGKRAKEAVGPHELRMAAPKPEQVWYPTTAGLVRAYVFVLPTLDPPRDWQIIVDAETGAIIDKRDLIRHLPDGTGMVFDPNPVVSANNNTFRDTAATVGVCGFAGTAVATLDAQRVSRTLRDLTMSGSNFTLKGPWCELHNFAAPASTIPTETSGNFNYPCNDARFNAVMVYYHIDSFQRYLQSLGITNAHASRIKCDPLDNTVNAAWYSPVDGGLHFSDSGNCKPDRATDADVMIHEYQHAIQDNIVPGWAGSNNPVTGRDEAGAMGEGAGDFVTCAYFADHGGGFQREVFEDWVFAPAGLRRVDGTKTYPASWTNQVHADGEIWSVALWNIYRAIGGDATGGTAAAKHEAARKAMLRCLFGSYPLLATNASMPDGAEAVMRTNANIADYRGAHLREMLQSFHDRGILAVDPAADIYIRDDTSDPGTTAYHSPTFYASPDVWIRNNDDGGTTHQQPVAGQDNWFYARVRNRGSAIARAFVVTFNVKLWLGTEFVYPGDFAPYISAVPGFSLAAGANFVVKAKWPATLVPAAGAHGCILVSAFSPREPIPTGAHVWEHPNLAQKNTTILAGRRGDTVTRAIRFGNATRVRAEVATLEVRNPSALAITLGGNPAILGQMAQGAGATLPPVLSPRIGLPPIRVIDPTRILLDQGDVPMVMHLAAGSAISLGQADVAAAAITATQAASLLRTTVDPVRAPSGAVTALGLRNQTVARLPVALPARTDTEFTVQAKIPANAKAGAVHVVDIVQRNAADQVVGGVRLEIQVV